MLDSIQKFGLKITVKIMIKSILRFGLVQLTLVDSVMVQLAHPTIQKSILRYGLKYGQKTMIKYMKDPLMVTLLKYGLKIMVKITIKYIQKFGKKTIIKIMAKPG